jgi:hypothetical protein
MDTLVDEILQRIIHKAMACHAALPRKQGRCDPHPEMGAKAGAIGPRMAGVLPAFVNHFKLDGLQDFLQALCKLSTPGRWPCR